MTEITGYATDIFQSAAEGCVTLQSWKSSVENARLPALPFKAFWH